MKTNTPLQPREHPTLIYPNSTDHPQTYLLLQSRTVSPFLSMQFEEQQKTGFLFRWGQEFLHSFHGDPSIMAALSWFSKDAASPPFQVTAAERGRAYASMRQSLQFVPRFTASCRFFKAIQEHRLVSKESSGDNPAHRVSPLHVFNFLPIRRIWSTEECSSILVPLLFLHQILCILTFIAKHLNWGTD